MRVSRPAIWSVEPDVFVMISERAKNPSSVRVRISPVAFVGMLA